MIWFLVRVAVIGFVLWLIYTAAAGRFQAVKQHYSWMHPDPMAAL